MKKQGKTAVQALILTMAVWMSMMAVSTVQAASGEREAEFHFPVEGVVEAAQPETPGGENPGGETPGGENPGGEIPDGESPGGEDPGEENPAGEPGNDSDGNTQKGSGTSSSGGDSRNRGENPTTGDYGMMAFYMLTGLAALIFVIWNQRLKDKKAKL